MAWITEVAGEIREERAEIGSQTAGDLVGTGKVLADHLDGGEQQVGTFGVVLYTVVRLTPAAAATRAWVIASGPSASRSCCRGLDDSSASALDARIDVSEFPAVSGE